MLPAFLMRSQRADFSQVTDDLGNCVNDAIGFLSSVEPAERESYRAMRTFVVSADTENDMASLKRAGEAR